MEQKTTSHASSLSPIWEHLEAFIRELVGVLFVGIGSFFCTHYLGLYRKDETMHEGFVPFAMPDIGGEAAIESVVETLHSG